jgi:hypothetical protein
MQPDLYREEILDEAEVGKAALSSKNLSRKCAGILRRFAENALETKHLRISSKIGKGLLENIGFHRSVSR